MNLNELEIRVPDPWRATSAAGWQVTDAGTLEKDLNIDCDVVIVGTGAGGGTAAEILTEAGLSVVLVEEGPLKTSDRFNLDEREAFRDLYQEGLSRATKDASIGILQGRAVGGTTTVNWTSSFRTPPQTLVHWRDRFGVRSAAESDLAPWFERMEQRLGIRPWDQPPNANNDVLRRGCERLGYSWAIIPRNVNGCWNLGYCGMGCPTNAKQSMLLTTLPSALSRGARLYWRLRAERVLLAGDRVSGVECRALRADGQVPTGRVVNIRARHTVLAGGGINTPALLLRSQVPDPHDRVGKRTFLHVVPGALAEFGERVDSYYGAPQSVYSDHFQWATVADGPMGFKLEVMPMHPGFISALIGAHGTGHFATMQRLPWLNGMVGLMRDGFHEQSPGGAVELRDDGSPVLDYPVNTYVLDAARRIHDAIAEIQFAAGARRVRALAAETAWSDSLTEFRSRMAGFDYAPHFVRLAAAHVMGGMCMGEDPAIAACDSRGRYHHLRDLSVFDGSLFPTSIGANPQLSIFGLVAKLASELAGELAARPAPA